MKTRRKRDQEVGANRTQASTHPVLVSNEPRSPSRHESIAGQDTAIAVPTAGALTCDAPADDEDGPDVIVSGDPSAGANIAATRNGPSLKDRRIPNDQRITTPYMTKYERARILGTRALQIR